MDNMNKKNVLIVGLIFIVIIVFILISVFINDGGNKSNSKDNKNNKPEEKVDVNKLTKEKTVDGLKIDNVVISGDDKITITVDINNVTDKEYPATLLNFVLIDGEGKVLKKIPTQVSDIEPGEKETITVDVTGYYGDSRDFKLERR